MRTARRSVSSIADEHAHTDIPDRGSESVEALESDSRRWEGLGRHLTIDSSDVVQWSIGMYARLLKKLPKAVLELPFLRGCLPAFVLGLRVYRHCTLIFLGGRLPCPPPPPCSRPLREGWICRAAILAILQGLYHTYRRKTLRQSADWYSYLARLDSRREKSRCTLLVEFPAFALEGDSTDKEHLALPFICGMLPLIGGQSVTPFFQARRDQPSRFSCRFAI